METSVVQYNNDTKIADSKDINIYLTQEHNNT